MPHIAKSAFGLFVALGCRLAPLGALNPTINHHIWSPSPYFPEYTAPFSVDLEEALLSQNGPRELPQDGHTDAAGPAHGPAPGSSAPAGSASTSALSRTSNTNTARVPKKLSFVLEDERNNK